MKKKYFFFLLFCSQIFFSQIINFPDPKFKARLLESSTTNYYNMVASDLNGNPTVIDQNQDGEIDVQEALNISKISIDGANSPLNYIQFSSNKYFNIDSIEGINYFKNLKILECKNNNLTSIDFKNLTKLTQIYCHNNKISQFINFEDVGSLFIIQCANNLLANLDLSQSARNSGTEGYALYGYYGNPLKNLNLQSGMITIWAMLADQSQCPFYSFYQVTAICRSYPEPDTLAGLNNLTVNCFEADEYRDNLIQNNIPTNILADNCLIATEEIPKISFRVVPNPAKDFLKLDINEKIEKIQILDELGRLVSSPDLNQNKINISKLQSGIYYLNLSINGKSLKTKFIKE
ncbi:T9SS type A sorting domain-containing protein [Epilithonimonas caeni]|uniref:T9SS type A sorting domain-containing protein n=1 Tax=Epilithonimonas caeni TaxID=365343 RepID=UPI00048599FA|nr:T9SS type A sorting domain-containing protein [Epilithonimonas caeni]